MGSAKLVGTYPQVAGLVDRIVSENPPKAWCFSFNLPGVFKDICRYRGKLSPEQIEKLQIINHIPSYMQAQENGVWQELVEEHNKHFLYRPKTDFSPSFQQLYIISTLRSILDYYCNGELTERKEIAKKSWPGNDVLVLITQGREPNFDFEKMPTLSVWKETRIGDFAHPGFTGKNLLEIIDQFGDFLGLEPGDVVDCNELPDSGRLRRDSRVFYYKGGQKVEFLYAIQASNLKGVHAGLILQKYSSLLVGRHITENINRELGRYVSSLQIDGHEVLGQLWVGYRVNERSEIKIVLKNN